MTTIKEHSHRLDSSMMNNWIFASADAKRLPPELFLNILIIRRNDTSHVLKHI